MLTEQGKEAACDCLSRSGLADSTEVLATINTTLDTNQNNMKDPASTHATLIKDVPLQHASSKRQKKAVDIPPDTLDKVCYIVLVTISTPLSINGSIQVMFFIFNSGHVFYC